MALDAKQLASDIAANVHRATAAAPQGGQPASSAAEFCSIWPKAKPVLELIAGVINFVPGAGTTAGAVLQGLVKIGDQISGEVCS
jgi:hypothetical protein